MSKGKSFEIEAKVEVNKKSEEVVMAKPPEVPQRFDVPPKVQAEEFGMEEVKKFEDDEDETGKKKKKGAAAEKVEMTKESEARVEVKKVEMTKESEARVEVKKVETTKESGARVEVKKEKELKRKGEENLERHEAQKDGVEEKTSAEEAETSTGSPKTAVQKKDEKESKRLQELT